MNKVMATGRRGFLAVLAGLGLAAALRASPGPIPYGDNPSRLRQRLAGIIGCPDSAVVVGRAFLDMAPGEADPKLLADLICQGRTRSKEAALALDEGGTRRLVQTWIREDFAQGRTVSVQGWILSLTEARLYALTALS